MKRCQPRPIAHVVAEMRISRACAGTWVQRWRLPGDAGLQDRPSSPRRSPNATPAWVIEQIESWRREHKWSAQRNHRRTCQYRVCDRPATVSRHLTRLGDQAKVASRAK
ncbi:leucine zipper domain-containing protein [Streptomyces sp. LUP47B]|uniref:helix-turn-helix domain-containing protein n=1 Tax=unclassified Streptomyces TaxID=2593676 RepID=UPI00159F33F2